MDTKLTLQLDKSIIEKTKQIAKKHNQSLSKLVEDYFQYLIEDDDEIISSHKYPSITEELSGIIEIDDSLNITEEYTDYILKKYQ